MDQQNKLSPEERKKNREKFMIKDKENETIYRHYGELNGADFKLRKNKNCEIYILDWSKGMYIDDCEDCKIYCGPIDGSVFIRGSKNCQFSIIARQVRFRNCENLKVFTYCPSDPAVESSFNIYFAPFNAFFPHLKELFIKGEFKKEEKNHIDTPYDFTPSEELGGGAPHYLQLPEEEFFIKVINDNNEPVEEMYEGYSLEEPWIQNKKNELPSFEQKANNDDNDFNFMNDNDNNNNMNDNGNKKGDNNNNEPNVQPVLNDFMMPMSDNNVKNNDNNFMNMDDFFSGNNNLLNQNNQNQNNNLDFNSNFNNNNNNNNNFDFDTNNNNNNDNNNNNNFMDMNDFLGGNSNNDKSQEKKNIDFNMNNMNNNNMADNNNNFFNDNSDFNSFNRQNISKEAEEEMKREEIRNKQKLMRQERIRQKMEKEAKMRMEIMAKASEYMKQFYEERKKRIALNHEKLMQASNQNNNNSNGSPWGMVQSSFTGSSSNADRMKEVIMNKNKDQSQ